MEPVRPQTVAPDVAWFAARTPTLPPATHTNSFALGGREVLLVEPATPYDDERRAWLEWARSLAGAGRELVAIFLTHHHPDHVGGAAFLARELSLPLWAHHDTAARLPELTIARMLDEGDELVLDGPTPQRWRALLTPGHAPGHLCLFEPELDLAIVGDMVASVGTIVIDPIEGDLAVYLRELERLLALGPARALPAHGAPIDDPPALFRHYIAHRQQREARVLAALALVAGPATLEQLVAHAYADTPPAIWPLAKLSLESHLLKLQAEGRAHRTEHGWQPGPRGEA